MIEGVPFTVSVTTADVVEPRSVVATQRYRLPFRESATFESVYVALVAPLILFHVLPLADDNR